MNPTVFLPSLAFVWRGAMLALGVAAAVPATAGDVRSRPNPSHEFADAVARAERQIAADDIIAASGGASILRSHGVRAPRAVVLLHGFTDSPRQFAALAESLYVRGDNVFVPRLPHHAERGKDVNELAGLTAAELCAATDRAVDIAAGLGDSVVVVGLSVGGTMAAWAAEHRAEVRRAVVIAPPFEIPRVPWLVERPLVNLGSHVPNLTRRQPTDTTQPDRDPGFATHALAQVVRLGLAVRRDAERATPTAEVLFLVNASDHTVKMSPVLDVARVWNRRGAPVSVYEFPASLALPHNILDPRRGPAAAAAVLPVLEALAHGEHPPVWIAARR